MSGNSVYYQPLKWVLFNAPLSMALKRKFTMYRGKMFSSAQSISTGDTGLSPSAGEGNAPFSLFRTALCGYSVNQLCELYLHCQTANT
jgi:hypothetical protein